MRRKTFWISAGCILAVIALRPVFSSGAVPGSNYKIIYSFTGADGAVPMSDLTLDGAGNLYGTTAKGGTGTACAGGCGTVFELKRTADGWKEEVLHSFLGGLDGAGPEAGVIFDNSGNLHGTTIYGGSSDSGGTVFKLSPNSRGGWTEKIIYTFTFNGSAGFYPQGDLAFDDNGNLYGTTQQGANGGSCNRNGCGAVFKLAPRRDGSWTESTIYSFAGAPDGGNPSSGLLLEARDFYGTTGGGGTGSCYVGFRGVGGSGCGTIYKLTPNSDGTWTERVIYVFPRGAIFGKYPSGGLLSEKDGHLFGTAWAGGDGYGTVFGLLYTQGGSWQDHPLHIFYGHRDGATPVGRLVTDTTGNLFGVTSGGRTQCCGTVFELRRSGDGWREHLIHTFGVHSAMYPKAGLVLGPHRQLYGTTSGGGAYGQGVVYEVTP
jgi:uncharacterized repeat protein (TIGR03803 family)